MLKKTKLRYNEYYDMQRVYDSLYSASKNGNNFYKLLEIIGSEENIRLAYRNLKSNKGSNTKGTDGKTIDDIKELTDETVINTVREMLADYETIYRGYSAEEIPDTTKLIIAQRISSIQSADRIIVMDEGKISGFGTHEELMKTNAIYQEVYNSQIKGGGDFDENRGGEQA